MLTDAQRALRRTGVGGSEIGAVAGLSPYATALDVWRAKVEGLEIEETPAMRRGRLLEPAVAEWYAEETGAELLPGETLRHPSREIVIATPDRIAVLGREQRVLEVKTTNFRMLSEWGEPDTDEIPQTYLCQVQWQLAVTGLARADVAALIGGDEFRVYHVAFDAELFGMLADTAERFWRDHVTTRRPPPLDGSDSCAEWIRARFPRDGGNELAATPDAECWADTLFDVRRRTAILEAEEQEAVNHLKALMGDASVLRGNGWRVTWKTAKESVKTDWEAVARALDAPPELVARFTTTKPGSRRFLPTQTEK